MSLLQIMFLGQVITKNKAIETIDFINVISDTAASDNPSIYTLVIGKQLAEGLYGKENVHILDKKINDTTWWTYAKNEKHKEYDEGINKFNSEIIKVLKDNIKYEFLNVLTEDLSKTKAFITYMKGAYRKVIYCSYDHLYIYRKSNNTVYGISLSDMKYIGIDIDKTIDKIKSNPYNTVITDNDFLSSKTREYLGNDEKLIPYLYFLSKE